MKVAVVNPNLDDSIGGGEAVSLAILNLLSENNDVDYFSKNAENIEDVVERFGYSIPDQSNIKLLEEAPIAKALHASGKFVLLRKILNDRKVTKKFGDTEYDLVFFTAEMFDFDREFNQPTVQYAHSPPSHLEASKGLKRLYEKFWKNISDGSLLDTDLRFFNSSYTKSEWEATGYVVNPPIKTDFEFKEKTDKIEKAIAVGRIAPDKNFKEVIDITEKTGLDLTIAGLEEDNDYLRELRSLEERKSFLEIKTDLPREELKKEVEESKIGFLSKRNEHFGMVVVEYMKAGVLPMVRNEGGPKEIVPGSEFTYDSVKEASEKIHSNLENFEELQEKVRERSKEFSEEKFRQEIQKELEKIL